MVLPPATRIVTMCENPRWVAQVKYEGKKEFNFDDGVTAPTAEEAYNEWTQRLGKYFPVAPEVLTIIAGHYTFHPNREIPHPYTPRKSPPK